MENVLEIKNLSVSIKKNRILNRISLAVEKGKITGMIGGSGSGKTTLIRTILDIQMPEDTKIEGEIFINGEIANAGNRMFVQPVFQDPGGFFNPRWNLQQCLEEPLEILTSISKQEKMERIKSLMMDFSLSEKYLSQSIRRFSGGELQRISLIRAILCNPEVLLMDEPVSGLDPLIQKEALRFILELNSKKKITIFLISHDIDFISKLCDFVYVIQNGEIVEKNFTSTILRNPQHEYTELLLQSRNLSRVKDIAK